MVETSKELDGRIDFYNKVYSDRPDMWDLEWRDKFAFYVLSRHTEKPESLLDIGCGNGHTIDFFSKRWPDTTYYGVDLSDMAIEIAKGRVPSAFFSCSTFEDLVSYPPKDVVVLMGVAEHFEDLVPSLRRLKSFGKLIYIESPNCLLDSDNKEEGFRATNNVLGQPEWHLRRSTWEQYIKFAGLEIVESYPGPTDTTEFIWMLK
jgi:SAM-dependent methyltransferase